MTNREKFIETFGVSPQNSIGCNNITCMGTKCKDCTFLYRENVASIWDLEYKEPPIKKEIKAGDIVRITDSEEQYTNYNALFNRSNLSGEIISRFNSGVDLNEDLTYKVLEILENENYDVYIAVIQNEFDDVYLIGVNGLEVI